MARRAGVTSDDTKALLLEAAARVFAHEGYEGAGVSAIAREAGLTTGAIYAHFANKAELLTEAVHVHGQQELASLQGLEGVTSFLEVIERLGAELPRRASKRGALVTEAVVAGRRDPEVRRVLRRQLEEHEEALIAFVRAAQRDGEIDPDLSADDLVRLTTLVFLGSLAASVVGLPATDPSGWSEVISRLISSVRPKEEA